MDRAELDAAMRASEARAASRFRGRVFWALFLAGVAGFAWWWNDREAREVARRLAARQEHERQMREAGRFAAEMEAKREELEKARAGR